jgi:hypothetical protein
MLKVQGLQLDTSWWSQKYEQTKKIKSGNKASKKVDLI